MEDLSELRELSNFERGFNEAAGEEVECFLGAEAAADVGSLDGNRLDEGQEYPAKNHETRYAARDGAMVVANRRVELVRPALQLSPLCPSIIVAK